MGTPNSVNPLLNGGSPYYLVNRSLRFRSSASAYLNRTPSVASNRTTWTWSAWVKKAATTQQGIFSSQSPSSSADYDSLEFYQDTIRWYFNGAIGSFLRTTAVYRDPSAWYHIVASVDTTQATASNRMKLYINGVQVTAFTNETYPSQNYNTFANNTYKQAIGAFASATSSAFFDGYMAEINFIDGQQLTPSSFGVFDTNGIWQPIRYSGTYGTNGFYLPFLNTTSTTTLVQDQSGNGNNWTPNNISLTAGTTYDSMIDSPTVSNVASNYPTMNPLDKGSNLSLSNGNLQLTITAGGNDCLRCTMAIPSTGKWYWEGTLAAVASGGALGFADATTVLNSGSALTGVGYSATTGQKFQNNWTGVSYGSTYTTNDIIGVAIDSDAGTVTFYKNNVSQGVAYSSINFATTRYFPFFFTTTGAPQGSWIVNFGQRPFSYTPPTGYNALNTANLPTPSINNGALYMAATTYTGNGSSQSISNGGNNTLGTTFAPDFVWVKYRNQAYNNDLFDTLRGVSKYLRSNSTAAELSYPGYGVTAFNSNGFSVTDDSVGNYEVNGSSGSIVAWQWKAGGTGVTNTSGTITSTVSANPTAGFSVVTFTAQSSGTGTVGHGLGVAPSLIITKPRANAYGWTSYHESLGNTKYIELNTTSAASTLSTVWNNTSPTSTVFTLGSSFAGNGTYVAYCFAAVSGYSAMGSYTGNGSSDGPFIFTNFRPRWVMVKKSSAAGNWLIFDTSRSPYNVQADALFPNLSNAETTTTSYNNDFLSNGFKIRTSDGSWNDSGVTYVYAAFAESPFTISRAR